MLFQTIPALPALGKTLAPYAKEQAGFGKFQSLHTRFSLLFPDVCFSHVVFSPGILLQCQVFSVKFLLGISVTAQQKFSRIKLLLITR